MRWETKHLCSRRTLATRCHLVRRPDQSDTLRLQSEPPPGPRERSAGEQPLGMRDHESDIDDCNESAVYEDRLAPPSMLPNGNTPTAPHMSGSDRMAQVMLIGSLLGLCWLGMQAVHEAGHAAAAWLTGAQEVRVTLHPLTISRTDVRPNPRPLIVAWSGPVVGVLGPVLLWLAGARFIPGIAYLLRFYAGFCLVANGAYLGAGLIAPVGDAATLRQLGTSAWPLALFGAVCVPCGLALWHGEGSHFGSRGRTVDRRHALAMLTLFVSCVAVLFMLGWR